MDLRTAAVSIITLIYGYIQVSAELWKSIDLQSVSYENYEDGQMSGWVIREYGGINSLEFSNSLALPVIKTPHEVLIEVYVTAVNPLDQLMTEGYGKRVLNTLRWLGKIKEFPLVLGREFCGVVRDKGKSVRADIQIGEKVWGVVPPHQSGSLAELVVVDQHTITRKPEGIDDIGAASILYAGLTAWSSLFISGFAGGFQGAKTSSGGGSGLRLCILGASGGVGTLAVQMAKAENMIITATCGTDSVQLVKDLGADRVIDYRKEDLNEAFRDQIFDIILDAAGQGPEYATKFPWKFSQYITLVPPLLNNTDTNGLVIGSLQSAVNLIQSNIATISSYNGFLKWGFFVPASQGIEYLKKLVENGKMKPIIDSIYEFNSAKEGFDKVAKGHLRGKVIVKIKEL